MRQKNIRLEDIAKHTGVSIVTVSNALKGKKGVSDELREKILETAAEMGYSIRKREKSQNQKAFIIGVIVAERYVKEFPSFYMDVYKRVAQEAAKKGHLTVLEVVSPEKEKTEKPLRPFLESELAGMIVIGELAGKYMASLRDSYALPVVCIDYYDIYSDMDYVVTNGFDGMEQLTRLLLEAGYRDMAFVGTPDATKNITDRYLGYCKALEAAGITGAQENVIPDRDFEGGDYRIDVQLPERLPEAFVCNCDKTAALVLEKLRDRGVRVPEDVAVAGFDNYYAKISESTALTTYENDEKAIAQISLKMLLKRIEGKKNSGKVRMVTGWVVEGNTVGKKGGAQDA